MATWEGGSQIVECLPALFAVVKSRASYVEEADPARRSEAIQAAVRDRRADNHKSAEAFQPAEVAKTVVGH